MSGYKFSNVGNIVLWVLTASVFYHLQCANAQDVKRKPEPSAWISGRHPKEKLNLISWLVDGCFYYKTNSTFPSCDFSKADERDPPEFQSFDGFFNNVFETSLGAVDTPLLRRVPPVYNDGTYEPVKGHRINPFQASDKLMKRSPNCKNSKGETSACGSKTGKTAFLVYFGQQVVEEILDSQRPGCPPEYFNIPIPENHEYHKTFPKKKEMPLLRSRYSQMTGHSPGNPRQQLNEITPWLDGGLIYGTAKAWADVLRTFPNGTLHPGGQLASDNDEGLFPVLNSLRLPMANPPPPAFHRNYIREHETANVNRFFVLGNPRGNENAYLLAFGVVLFRWHNQFALYFKETRPSWSGERVFQEARKWSIATYQQIVVYNWLPEWLGEPLSDYNGYNPSVHPQIEQFFQTAAMRFGHTLVTPGVYMRDYQCGGCKPVPFYGLGGHRDDNTDSGPGPGAIRTCNIYWRPQEPLSMEHELPSECLGEFENAPKIADIDRLLMGMASQRAEREDNMIVEDLRGRVFGPLEFSRRDLMAINIQRGRDHGTPDYNTAREAFGLERINSTRDYVIKTNTATPVDIVEEMVKIHKHGPEYSNESAWKNIDVWTGGILETSERPGPLFRAIIKDQFMRIRDADRFWFENTKWENPRFSDDQIMRIRNLNIFDMIVSVTLMKEEDIQSNPFRVPEKDFKDKCGDSDIWEESICQRMEYNSKGFLMKNDLITCFHFPQLGSSQIPLETCTDPGSFDYFEGSEMSFILTFIFLGVVIIGIGLCLKYAAEYAERKKIASREEQENSTKALSNRLSRIGLTGYPITAREWQGKKDGTRSVVILLNGKTIETRNHQGDLLREIDLKLNEQITVIIVGNEKHVILKHPCDYDLVLEFEGTYLRNTFLKSLRDVLENSPVLIEEHVKHLKQALSKVMTKRDRIDRLEKFFKLIFLVPDTAPQHEMSQGVEHEKFDEIREVELSLVEFAEALGMSPKSAFAQNIFNLVDTDGNGHVSFLEFFSMLVVFKKGSPEDKAQYLFSMYDTDRDGLLSLEEFRHMLQSITEANLADRSEKDMNELVTSMVSTLGVDAQGRISLDKFQKLFVNHKHILRYAQLNFDRDASTNRSRGPKGVRASYIETTQNTFHQLLNLNSAPPVEELAEISEDEMMMTPTSMHRIFSWFETYRLQVFWLSMYIMVSCAIFAERAYYYTVEREHGGLRQIAGLGVTVTRGAASVQMFCYASLLLTMCRNTITYLRETFLRQFIPFDSFHRFHKFIAYFALFFTTIHVVGHGVNFYHISTQTPEDLTCLFRNYYRPTHELPKFHYWVFQTVTGISGILLVILAALMYTFASNYSRTYTYKLFWITHYMYPIFYALVLLHGSGNLVQEPIFLNFLLGPLFLFIFDKLLSLSRQSVEIPVIKVELLPSRVTMLKFARPPDFEFKSGQWVRLACTALNYSEFHPFTISSAPHENFLTVHIRAVGPFTNSIRRIYEDTQGSSSMPKLYLDGPYGGFQEWRHYEVSVLIGGGIGVTPFASILKDIAAQPNRRLNKKVYFIWISRTQKQFEWMVDIIKNVENHPIITVHVFITQANNQYDLRTVLLYVCEQQFKKINNRSLFTGLKSVTHFGLPNFDSLLKSFRRNHEDVEKFGVFTCGPPPLIKSVNDACQSINTSGHEVNDAFEFQHHYENFK